MYKKIEFKWSVLILFIFFTNLFGNINEAPLTDDLEVKGNILLNEYQSTNDFHKKISTIHEMSKIRYEKAFSVFVNDLCFSNTYQTYTSERNGDAHNEVFREKLVIALKSYKHLSPTKLVPAFYAMKKIIEEDSSTVVVGETAITLATWIKKWNNSFKKQFIASINSRVGKISVWDSTLALKFSKSLRIVESQDATPVLIYMIKLGFINNVNNHIAKTISFYSQNNFRSN